MTDKTNKILKFKVGETYHTRSNGDWDCIYSFKVVKRTDKTVWLESHFHNKPKARRVRDYFDCNPHNNSVMESVAPLGSYAMSPLLCADDNKPLKNSYDEES